ncbi:MAG: hypothetical protein QNJ85_17975 [Gammaproteobacteria bacterium]|nr:hypothetical protein [Gammaproteobacteria bacterium]
MENDQKKKKAVEDRIKSPEENLIKAHEYLENGSHANWHGFQPWFRKKIRNEELAHPHKDWIRNVFIPRCERAIHKAEKQLDRLE